MELRAVSIFSTEIAKSITIFFVIYIAVCRPSLLLAIIQLNDSYSTWHVWARLVSARHYWHGKWARSGGDGTGFKVAGHNGPNCDLVDMVLVHGLT